MSELFLGENIRIEEHQVQNKVNTTFDAPNTSITNLEKIQVKTVEISQGLTMKGTKISELANATQPTDAVSLQQLEATEQEIYTKLQETKQQLEKEITDAEKELTDKITLNVNQLNTKIDVTKAELDKKISDEHDLMESKIATINQNIDTLNGKVTNLTVQFTELSDKLDSLCMYFFKSKSPKFKK